MASDESKSHYATVDAEIGCDVGLLRPFPILYPTKPGQPHPHPQPPPSPPHCLSARTAAVAALVLSLLCLLIIVGGGVFFFLTVRPELQNLAAETNEEVCLPCIQVNPDPLQASPSDLLSSLPRKYKPKEDTEDADTIELCCARTPAQYASLFKLILKRQEGVKKLADILGSSNNEEDGDQPRDTIAQNSASAHLLLKPLPQDQIDSAASEDLVQHWKSPEESAISHVRGGVTLHDNRVYVQTPGLYFVYCQILYNRAVSEMQAGPQVASNYVKRSSVLYPPTSGILLKARHTRFNQQRDRHSSYVGGLFFLHEGDALFVQVSMPELISHDDTASFFGLFRVG